MISEIIQDHFSDICYLTDSCRGCYALSKAVKAERLRLATIFQVEGGNLTTSNFREDYDGQYSYEFPPPLGETTFYFNHHLKGKELERVETSGWSFEFNRNQITNFWLDLENKKHVESFEEFLRHVVSNLEEIPEERGI